MKLHRRQPSLVVKASALGAALVVLLAACGSSSKKAAAVSPSGSGSGPAPTKSPLVVGVMGAFTGPQAPANVPDRDAIQAWAKWTNAHGGVNGHSVQLVVEDDGGNTTTALANVKDLVENKHVLALIANRESGSESAWASYIQQQKVPVVGGENDTAASLTNPDFFPGSASVTTSVGMQPAVAKTAGAKSFGSFYCAEVSACAQAIPLLQAATGKLGIPLTFKQSYSASAPDFTALCLAAKQANTESIAVDGNGAQRVVDSCSQQGYKPIWVIPSGGFVAGLVQDSALNNALVPLANFPWFVDDPAAADYHAAMKQYAPNTTQGPDTTTAWVSGQMFAKAAANVPDKPTPADIVTGLYTFKGETLGGLVQSLTFTNSGQPNPPINCYYTVELKNGTLTSPTGMTPACLPT